jgi:hypothetical protein
LRERVQTPQVRGSQSVIDRIFPWENIVAAFKHLKSGAHLGEIVIAVAGGR